MQIGGAVPPETEVAVDFAALGLKKSKAKVRDLWARQNLGVFTNRFSVSLKTHACGLYLIK